MKKGMNKRGLSDVVTTVLIILFAIVAVAVVGGIVLNQINKAGKNIDKATFCTENVVEPVTCVFTNNLDGDATPNEAGDLAVRVGYTRTNGDSPLFATTPIRVNLELADATITSGQEAPVTMPFNKGSSDTIAVNVIAGAGPLPVAQNPKTIEIATTYVYKGTENQVCTSKKLDCTL